MKQRFPQLSITLKNMWQKPLQYCKVISLQLIKKIIIKIRKKKKTETIKFRPNERMPKVDTNSISSETKIQICLKGRIIVLKDLSRELGREWQDLCVWTIQKRGAKKSVRKPVHTTPQNCSWGRAEGRKIPVRLGCWLHPPCPSVPESLHRWEHQSIPKIPSAVTFPNHLNLVRDEALCIIYLGEQFLST